FTWDDLLAGRAVVVLDEAGARRLFPGLEPEAVIGLTVTDASGTTGARYQIVGIVAPAEDALLQIAMQTMQAAPDLVMAYVPATSRPWRGETGAAPDPRQETFDTVYFTPEDDAMTPQVVAA